MLQILARAPAAEERVDARLTLVFDQRQKSRHLARLDGGEEVALILPRGSVLRGGDRLVASDGRVVLVVSEPEELSVAEHGDALLLARAAYHLGNRHVALQVEAGRLCYQHDHVLDHMVRELGLAVSVQRRAFEPEAGAYGHSHAHGSHAHHAASDHHHDRRHDHTHAANGHSHGDRGHAHTEHGHSHAQPRREGHVHREE